MKLKENIWCLKDICKKSFDLHFNYPVVTKMTRILWMKHINLD